MKNSKHFSLALVVILMCTSSLAHAFFFFIPIPNLAKPPALQNLVNALEKSSETKALAYVSEDKTFGGKMWVWGHYAGVATQEDANSKALRACEQSLNKASSQLAGGQPIHNFGNKRCELHEFTNKTLKLPPVQDAAAPTSPPSNELKQEILPSPQPTASAAEPNSASLQSPQSLESKLKQLQSLFEQKLISKEEYEQKKKTLLDAL
jgi:hypothetical protein